MDELYHDAPEQSTKVCSMCLVEKPLSDFYKTTQYKSGYKKLCKACCSKKNKPIPIKKLVQLPLCFETKACNKCKEVKPLDCFDIGTDKFGRATYCKACFSARYKERYSKHVPRPEPINGGKICTICGIEKPYTEYAKSSDAKDKLCPHCKACKKNRYLRNRDHYSEYGKERYKNNKEVINAQNKERWEKNKEHYHQKRKEWVINNRDKSNEIIRRYHARKRGATVEKVDYDLILQQHGRHCHICNKPIETHQKLHFDHVIPLNRGGEHSQDNVLPSHNVCNTRKKDKLMSELTEHDRRGVS